MENLKMKTKIKNEFQNPDLIFKNENQNWKTKIEIENWFLFLKKVIDKQKSMWYIDYRNKQSNKFKEDLKNENYLRF